MNNLTLPTRILKGLNTSSSLGMFARDTGGCLLAKLAVSRSKDEAKEIGFAELSESALFYFSAPAVAKATSKVFSKKYNIEKELISKHIDEIKNVGLDKLKNIKLAKFAQIASTFGVILPLVFAIAPVRNILTYANKGKDEFVSVVGLKKEDEQAKQEEAKQKAFGLIKSLLAVSAVSLAALSVVLTLAKNNKIYEKIKPFVSKVVRNFEFTNSNDLKMSHYGAFIYPVSIASYYYASRDKYEVQENTRRFATTVPLMFFGEKLIEKPIHKGFDKLFNTKVIENGVIKSYDEILKLPSALQKQYLKSKNFSYGLTFLTNTMVIAAAVGILNRVATKKRYERENKKNNV